MPTALTGALETTSPIGLLVEDYLDEVRARGVALAYWQNTLGYPLRKVFLRFCRENGVVDTEDLTERLLTHFANYLGETGGERGPLALDTRHTYTRAVRQFLKWAGDHGNRVPDVSVPLPRLRQTRREILTREEIQRLEDAARDERDKLILRFLADTGLRVSELCQLTIGDVDADDQSPSVLVRNGKGGKDRRVPLAAHHIRRLKRHLVNRPPELRQSHTPLFLSRQMARGNVHQPMTPSGVQQLVRNLAYAAGVSKRTNRRGGVGVSPHLLRHSFTTYMHNRGMSLKVLASILGHANESTLLRIYSHPSDADISAQYLALL